MIEVIVLRFENFGDAQCSVEFRCQIPKKVASFETLEFESRHRCVNAVAALIVKEGVVSLSITSSHFNRANSGSIGFCTNLALLNQV